MDLEDIRRLADQGIAAFPPAALGSAAEWLWDYGEATGDARFCSLSRTLGMLADAFDQFGAIPTSITVALDAVLAAKVSDILSAEAPADGSMFARQLRESIAATIQG